MYLDWLFLAVSLEWAANPGIEPHTSSWSTPTSYLIQARWTAAAGFPASYQNHGFLCFFRCHQALNSSDL
jgi:hypothetical protein